MKKLVVVILALGIVLSGFGCNMLPRPIMIEKLEICSIVCVDYDDGSYTIGVGINKVAASSGEDKKGSSSTEIVTKSGDNLSNILKELMESRELNLYFGDIDTVIMGEGVVNAGIDKVLDFFIRSDKFNLYANIYTTSGSATELLEQLSKDDAIDSIGRKAALDVVSDYTDKQNFITIIALLQDNSSGVMPIITVHKDGDKNDYLLEGLNVVHNKKSVGTLNKQQSRGYNIIQNNINNGISGVELDGFKAGVDNLVAKTKIKPTVNGDKFNLDVRVEQSASIAHITDSRRDDIDTVRQIEGALSDNARGDIVACLDKIIEYKADFAGVLSAYKIGNKKHYNEIASNMDDILSSMSYSIDSRANVKRAHQVR